MIPCPGRSRQAAWRRVASDEASDKPGPLKSRAFVDPGQLCTCKKAAILDPERSAGILLEGMCIRRNASCHRAALDGSKVHWKTA